MLTAQQIREIAFTKTLGGYKTNEVDLFIDEAAATVEALTAKQAEDHSKMEVLASKLMEYRSQEENIQNTMLNAQRSADSLIREAQQSADLTLQDAEIKKTQTLEEMERQVAEKQAEFEKMTADLTASFEQKNADMTADFEQKSANAQASFDADKADKEAKIAAKEQELVDLKDKVAKFQDDLLDLYRKHLELIGMMPGEKAPKKAEPVEAPVAAEPEIMFEAPAAVEPEISFDVPTVEPIAVEPVSFDAPAAVEPEITFDAPAAVEPEISFEAPVAAEPEISFGAPAAAEPEANPFGANDGGLEFGTPSFDLGDGSGLEFTTPAGNDGGLEFTSPAGGAMWADEEIVDLPADKENRFADLQFGDNYDVGGSTNPFGRNNE